MLVGLQLVHGICCKPKKMTEMLSNSKENTWLKGEDGACQIKTVHLTEVRGDHVVVLLSELL